MTGEKKSADWKRAVTRLAAIKEKKPLVHCITNYVTVNDCANALLAIGARPVMSHAPEEAAEITAGSRALILNLGATEYFGAMKASLTAASSRKIPVVLDPVGVSGSRFRREFCLSLLRSGGITALRGNGAELAALYLEEHTGTGVDAVGPLQEHTRKDIARGMAERYGCYAICTGETDYICGPDGAVSENHYGSPWMARLTGTGCMGSAVLGAFLSEELSLAQAYLSQAFMGLAGEQAAESCEKKRGGVGSFHVLFLDALTI